MLDVASFYRFVDVEDSDALRADLTAACERGQLLGTILVAPEGVNGTLAGSAAEIRDLWGWLNDRLELEEPLSGRWTDADTAPFRRLRVRVKKEIVALGRPDIRPQDTTGRRIPPAEWNELLADPDTVVIDTRNRYEIEVGRFAGAIDPRTDNFRDFVSFAENLAERGDVSFDRPVAMYCTGGIRCEKATALMHELGFRNVGQLEGGILKYLETMEGKDNAWQGECFVFDTRVAVDRDLAAGGYVQCHACRRPLSEDDVASPHYREGVSCPRCFGDLAPERAARLEERRKQVRLARHRGVPHIGSKT